MSTDLVTTDAIFRGIRDRGDSQNEAMAESK